MNTRFKVTRGVFLGSFLQLFILLFLGLGQQYAQAQDHDGLLDPSLVITVGTETYSPITGTLLYGAADDGMAVIYLPFAFRYDKKVYPANSQLRVSPNGWLGFPNYYFYGGMHSGSIMSSNPLTYSSRFSDIIFLVTGDNYVRTSLRYATLGTAPNRRFVVQWQGFSPISYSSYQSNVQIILYEADGTTEGKIRIHWGTCNPYTQNNNNVSTLIGNLQSRYINIDPTTKPLKFYTNRTNNFVNNTTIKNLFSNNQYIEFSLILQAELLSQYPTDGKSFIGNIDLDADEQPGVLIDRKNSGIPAPDVKYEIFYNLANGGEELVYAANDGDWVRLNIAGPSPVRYNFKSATGMCANADGTFKMHDIPGGWYTVRTIFKNNKDTKIDTVRTRFFVDRKVARYIRGYPEDGAILTRGFVVGGTDRPAVMITKEWPTPVAPVPTVKYSIFNSSNEVVYTALSASGLEEIPIDVNGVNQRFNFINAVGPYAGANGALDLTNAEPGPYTIRVEFDDKVNPVFILPETRFTIIRAYDIVNVDVNTPRGWLSTDPPEREEYRYSLGAEFPIEYIVYNGGGVSIESFNFNAKIYKAGSLVKEIDHVWTNSALPIKKIETRVVTTPTTLNTAQLGVGTYELVTTVTSLTPPYDDDLTNNMYPREGVVRYFRVMEAVDISINAMNVPSSRTYRYPFVPSFSITNNGTEDPSGSWAYLEISEGGNVLHYDTLMLQNISYGTTSRVDFNKVFFPRKLGTYTVTLTFDLHGLPMTRTFTFTVQEGLKGIYTLGSGGDFRNFDEAIDALYLRGVSGNVVFELTDASYELGGLEQSRIPDFRSKIIGVGSDATITFRPNKLRSLSSEPINILINSPNGYGIRFGQALETGDYKVPAVNILVDVGLRHDFATSEGYIIFDGGNRKNIKFTMQQPANVAFSAPIYIGEGSKNIAIKNCRIIGRDYTSCDLPTVRYSNESIGFVFENNTYVNPKNVYDTLTYSAGVVVRNKPLPHVVISNAVYTADTLANTNIIIEGNIIEGFGYGIVSLGTGPIASLKANAVEMLYNDNNQYIGNYINNIAKGGIFLGFENNTIVKNNRIDSIGVYGLLDQEIYGIKLGGEYKHITEDLAYHNLNIDVNGNEISNIYSNLFAYGIKVEQHPINLVYNSLGYSFPSKNETNDTFKIFNNIVYDLKTLENQVSTHKVGIGVGTTRQLALAYPNALGIKYAVPSYPESDTLLYLYSECLYNVSNALVANNTVSLIDNDINALETILTGISIQNVNHYEVLNNAIHIVGNGGDITDASYFYASALMLQSVNPNKTSSKVNWNAYYVTPMELDKNLSLVRFFEMDEMDRFLDDGGYASEYISLPQWIGWTGQDAGSVTGFDFVGEDMERSEFMLNGLPLYDILRMQSKNNLTTNSPLNNRASHLYYVTEDAAGNSRVNLDQNPDIGALEFDCKTYLTDVEVKMITAPAAYRDMRGKFNDAEYVMIGGPAVDVKALVRNNGDVLVSNYPVRCQIFKANNFNTAVRDTLLLVNLAPGEEKEYSFCSASDESNLRFEPEPYNGLLPDKDYFMTMRTNVTPIYTIIVNADPDDVKDEYSENNRVEKKVRFYVPSNSIDKLYLLISAENTTANLDASNIENLNADIIAGKLNYDTLVSAFNSLKFFASTSEQKARHFDIIDRTAWEPRAIDYTVTRYNKSKKRFEPVYNSLFWADGDDKELNYWEKRNLIDFADAGEAHYKKNIVIASQEIARENMQGMATLNDVFSNKVLRTKVLDDGIISAAFQYGAGEDVYYKIKGFLQAHNLIMDIKPTQYVPDNGPVPGTFRKIDTVLGQNYVGYYYYKDGPNADRNIEEKMSLISGKTLTVNNIFGAFDWRHLSDASAFLAGVLDDIGSDLIVPVEFVSFNANAIGKRVVLDWSTASEINTSKFDLERATILSNEVAGYGLFNNIASMKAAGTSNVLLNYNYIDNNVNYGENYVYRLRVEDADGSYSYSDVREVTIENVGGVSISGLSPNPATAMTSLDYTLSENVTNLHIAILDMSGKIVETLYSGSKEKGSYNLQINVTNMASGTYSILFNIDGKILTEALNVVK